MVVHILWCITGKDIHMDSFLSQLYSKLLVRLHVTHAAVHVKSLRDVTMKMCVLKLCRIWNVLGAEGGCVSRKLKVLDKTKWIWQARLIRQRFGDPFQTRRKRKKKHRQIFPLSPRRLLIRSLSPPIKMSMFTNPKQCDEITTLHPWEIENTLETQERNMPF